MQVAFFRPETVLQDSIDFCEGLGLGVYAAPSVELEPVEGEIERFLDFLETCSPGLVIFTSQNSIKLLKETLGSRVTEVLKKNRVAAIGVKTKRSLEREGVEVDVVPDKFSSKGVVDKLRGLGIDRAVVARSDKGSNELLEASSFMEIEEFPIYEIVPPEDDKPLKRIVEKSLGNEIDSYAFTSTMVVKNFLETAKEMSCLREVKDVLNKSLVAALGEPTRHTLEEEGISVDVTPEAYTFESMIKELVKEKSREVTETDFEHFI